MNEAALILFEAICRHSPLIADNILGVSLKGDDLREVYEAIGQHYVKHKATDRFMSTAADLTGIWKRIENSAIGILIGAFLLLLPLASAVAYVGYAFNGLTGLAGGFVLTYGIAGTIILGTLLIFR